MAKKVLECFEENRDGDGDTVILVGHGDMNFLWLEMTEGKLLLCDCFEGLISEDPSDYDIEQLVVDWLNDIHAEPSTANDVTFFTPVHRNGKFEVK